MSRKKIPSREALVEALRDLDGNLAAVGRRFHCARSHVWHVVNDDPELRELVDELSEGFKDVAEQTLFSAIRKGNIIATIFYLKTRVRDRGYSERLELVPMQSQQIEVELGVPTFIEAQNDHAEALDGNGAAIALLGE